MFQLRVVETTAPSVFALTATSVTAVIPAATLPVGCTGQREHNRVPLRARLAGPGSEYIHNPLNRLQIVVANVTGYVDFYNHFHFVS